jgi:uncharacterized protein with FMN-binding domain
MSNKLVALCSAAIGIVYVAGYMVTLPVAAEAQSDSAHPLPTSGSKRAPVLSKYKDGTYKGRGSNRIGSIEVTLTMKGDKITDVQISDCTTHYPQSRIDHLPAQVLARQSSTVDVVSGATKSTQDFKTAVDQALTVAMALAQSGT